jgi:hypothetical protein
MGNITLKSVFAMKGDERLETDVIYGYERVSALLTTLPKDLVALQQYYELIEIDGTQHGLPLRWDVIPIMMLDKGRHLACGGICLAARFTTRIERGPESQIARSPGW